MQASALGLDLHIEIESDDAEEKVLQLIKMGKQTCYTHAALSSPVPVQTSVTWNGREIELDDG